MMAVNKIRHYFTDTSGHFAVWMAVLALPLSLVMSASIDSRIMLREVTHLQSALDTAAIAAITHQTLTETERSNYAKQRFWLNIEKSPNISVEVPKSGADRVEMTAKIEVPTLMASIMGKKTITVSALSATELVKGSTVCMLALDPDSPRSFEVTEGASLDASTCGIQVNSKHDMASVVEFGGKSTAKDFCIAGGAKGTHDPYVNTQCSAVDNPYKTIETPPPGPCVNENVLDDLMKDWRSERDAIENHEILENQRWAAATQAGQIWYPTYFEKNHLKPGNYCNGLFMEGMEFILDPGVYHITNGSLVFGLGTELIGEGVTFVLHDGVDAEIRDGSILNLKGPESGPMQGLVIAQSMENKPLYSPKYPDVTSTITDGAMLNLLGTVYLPTHKIEFLGGSLSETRAPATSFIAHQISIRDGANIGVDVDHVAAGIAPIEPHSDSSARLIK